MEKNVRSAKLNGVSPEKLSGIVGMELASSLNISADLKQIAEMTPKDGFQKKLELISEAHDMSTAEKVAAIDAAENKYAQDLANNTYIYNKMLWVKAGLVLTCTACIVLMASSPDGRNIAKEILKLVS